MGRSATDDERAVAAIVAAELARHLMSPVTRARIRTANPSIDPDVIVTVIDRYVSLLERR